MPESQRTQLTEKEIAFCHEWVVDRNGARAARDAGYARNSAKVLASQLLRRPEVYEFCMELVKKREEKLEKKGIDVIKELDKIAYASITDFLSFSASGVLIKDSKELTADQVAAIKSIKQKPTEYGMQIEITLHDKTKALEMLGQHHGVLSNIIPIDANNKAAVAFIIPAFKNPQSGQIELPPDSYKLVESTNINTINADTDKHGSQQS